MSKTASQIPKVGAVWRIPTKEVYRRNHLKGDASWKEVYGKIRCSKCHQLFKELDVYKRDPQFVSGKVHKYQHVECPK